MRDNDQEHPTTESDQEMLPYLSPEQYLEIACRYSPVVNRTIEKYGGYSLADFLKEFEIDSRSSFQKRDDLEEVVYSYAAPLLGEDIAKRASQDLAKCPVVLTANHHGVDFFAQSMQGSLLFSFSKRNGHAPGKTVPIFSCGNVPLDNLTYPLGLLIYHVNEADLGTLPKKMPVFSNRFRRAMVSVSAPLEEAMVKRADTRVDKMVRANEINAALAPFLHDIFRQDYLTPAVMDLSSYSQQSVVLNNRLWKRLFSSATSASELVYLELEKIVQMLLEYDLRNHESLAWCVLFDSKLRDTVIGELDGERVCWDLNQLEKRLSIDRGHSTDKKEVNNGGTLFFWGINDSGRRIPLFLDSHGKNGQMLRGVDDRDNLWELPYTPQTILDAMKEKRLLPSLFSCFLVLSFARGVTCAGGYYQCEYLPIMQDGLVRALQKTPGYQDPAESVKDVSTFSYLSGMQAVMVRIKDDALIPAGPLEIFAGGGLTDEDIQQILSMTVRDAHLASLFETVPDVAPWIIKTPDWNKQLAADCFRLLEERVVIK
ncbi:hypothetical protein ACFL9T_03830 [Thermodesulfobacteriota bacterium]